MRYNLVDMASTVVSRHYDQLYSYCPSRSLIDHILTNADFSSCAVTFSVVQENHILTSDHLPLLCTFRINVQSDNMSQSNPPSRLAWDKASVNDIMEYQSVLDTTFWGLNMNTVTDVNSLNTSIVNAMQTCSNSSIPRYKPRHGKKCYWGSEIRQLYVASKQQYKLWVNRGRPRDADNAVLLSYRNAKSKLRRAQRQQSEKVYFQKFEELDRAASGDHRMFWKLLRNRNKKDTVQIQSLQVGNQTFKNDNVVEGFAEQNRGVFDFHVPSLFTLSVHVSKMPKLITITTSVKYLNLKYTKHVGT